MHFEVNVRGDANQISTLLAMLCNEDGGSRNSGNVLRFKGDSTVSQVTFSQGNLPCFWITATATDVQVFIGGATTWDNGSPLFFAALVPGVPIGNAYVNLAAAQAAGVIASVLFSLIPRMPRSMLLAGHSYGGAIAQVLCALLVQRFPDTFFELYSQGSPRVGDKRLAAVLDPVPKLRVMNADDTVPFFPPHFTEAPAATIAVGYLQAYNLSFWSHTGGGAILDPSGTLTPGELPAVFQGIADLSLTAWAAGPSGFLANGHSFQTYANRMNNQGPGANPPPVDPTQVGFKGELVLPLTPAEFQAGPVFGPILQKGLNAMAFSSVFIPVNYRWRPFRVGTVWYATWLGYNVVACQSHSQAKSICRAGNKFLKVLQNASNVSKGTMQADWGLYLTAAGSPTTGFMPVLTVIA